MDSVEALKHRVSLLDSTLGNLNSDDVELRMEAVLDTAALLTAAKRVVLELGG